MSRLNSFVRDGREASFSEVCSNKGLLILDITVFRYFGQVELSFYCPGTVNETQILLQVTKRR
jgi:hypothetical protein